MEPRKPALADHNEHRMYCLMFRELLWYDANMVQGYSWEGKPENGVDLWPDGSQHQDHPLRLFWRHIAPSKTELLVHQH